MSQRASDAFRRTGIESGRIGQTIGAATASAGTHEKDGVDEHGNEYTVCVDLRLAGSWNVSDLEILRMLNQLGHAGFAAWYRNPGHDGWPADQIRHIHAVYAGEHMKEICRHQIHDFCNLRNGLASHAPYEFHPPMQNSINTVRELFLAHNPVTG